MQSAWSFLGPVVAPLAVFAVYLILRRSRVGSRMLPPARPRGALGGAASQAWVGSPVIVGAAAVVVAALIAWQRIGDYRHPPVREHLPELLETAAGTLACARDRLGVTAESSTRARVDGCARSAVFRWKAAYRRGPQRWMPIDPTCKVSYLGCDLPCD